jgi:flavodoxin
MSKYFVVTLFITFSVLIYVGFQKTTANRKKAMEALLKYEGTEIRFEKNFQQKRVLVMYYSMGNNTRTIAEMIKDKTGANIYEIKTTEKLSYISAFFSKFTRSNVVEQTGDIDFSSYDIIFVGSPVWFYTVSAPVMSLLEQSNFAGKKVVPFATHRGGLGHFYKIFKANIKSATVLDGEDFYKVSGTDKNLLNNKISNWLNRLEI